MTGTGERIVIAGAGHAAGQVVATLKQQKFAGQIVLVGDEPWLPYQRPPLSKKFLAGEVSSERLYFKPESFYEDPLIEVRLQTRITAIDRQAKSLKIDGDEDIGYDKLVLALGSRAKTLNVEGADFEGVHYLRSISDVDPDVFAIVQLVADARRAVQLSPIIGEDALGRHFVGECCSV